jgi:hypothetical protein
MTAQTAVLLMITTLAVTTITLLAVTIRQPLMPPLPEIQTPVVLPAYWLLLMMSGVLALRVMAIPALEMVTETAMVTGTVTEMAVMVEMEVTAMARLLSQAEVDQTLNGHHYFPALSSVDLIREQGRG